MIQKNGIFAVLAGVGVVAVVLMAGLAVNTASGQQTDEIFVPSLPTEEAADDPVDVGDPPASPIEPVAPVTDPDGGPAADSGAPGADTGAPSALPDAGSGSADGSAAGYMAVLSLIAVAGLAVMGASALARSRRT